MREEEEGDEGFPGRLLHQAALWGNAELLEDLLHGDQVHHLDVADPLGRTALHAAATNENETCARILLQAGANPNIACGPRGFNKTPLHVAAENGHVAIVRLLIDYQADLLAKESHGFTAMDLAEQCGHPQVMEVLRHAADEQEQRRHELYQALANACSSGDVSQAKQIIKQLGKEAEVIVNTTPNGCNTLLFKACEDGQKEIVKLLLESGADGRIHPVTKYSPLYIACYNGRKDIIEILLKKFPELVQVTTVERWLPIHAAAISGHLHVLDLLLKFPYPAHVMQTFVDRTNTWEYSMPFNINAKDVTEQTVLYLACLVGNQRLLELLLKFRVRATKRVKSDNEESEGNDLDDGKRSAESESVISPRRKSNGLQTLMSKLNLRNDQPTQKIESNISPLDLDLYCNNCTETALHVSVRKKHYTLASLLLQNGANVNLRTTLSEEDLNKLDDDDCAYSGSTALVEACRNRDTSMVELLMRYGARDDECQALRVAAANKDEHLMSRLLALKAHSDPEYKINKKALEFIPGSQFGGFIGNVTFSSMFPTVPVMINWHGQHCLEYIREQWLIDASVSHNIKLKLTPRNQTVALLAITRLDVSNNQLTELPLCVFQMHSLKVLNAAQNKIERLPESISQPTTPTRNSKSSPSNGKPSSGWTCPFLEEIHLQDNRLDSVPPCLFQLPQLWFLDLSNNKLQSLPYNMWTAPKLRELNLALNILHDLPTHPSRIRSVSSVSDFSITSKDGSEECLTISTESSPRHSVTDSASIGGASTTSFELRCLSPPICQSESVREICGTNLLRQDLQHHNYWSKNVQVVEAPLDSDMDKKQQCQLVSLNLAHNAYDSVPPMLACLAVNLARLNLSYNYLTAMGSVQLYPANIKHLDLSHNRIKSWPTRRYEPDAGSDATSDVLCFGQIEGSSSSKQSAKVLPGPGVRKSPRILHSGWGSNSNISSCVHRLHTRLDNLRTLILADNELDKLILTMEDDALIEDEDDKLAESADVISGTNTGKGEGSSRHRSRILFPNLSMLDVSNNSIKEVPSVISDLCNLSVLNLSGNYEICHLPPEMGLLSKLWNLNTRGCNLNEPLKSMIESKKYKTMDIIGYLKSILEDAKTYARMKLMIVGVQGIGKTSLLEQLRQEGTGMYRKKPPEHWGKRMGNKNINLKTPKGVSISTVGVDVGDWTYEKKVRGQPSFGPVTFRTWDFGGQKEYYATHQYFLSKRSLYLVVWKMTDGERGIDGILQWLVNIQARAPNSPVIIVGTHYDIVKETYPLSVIEDLQHILRERFINVVDADKCGLPRVLDSIHVSCKTRHNIKHLCNIIYDTVFDLRCPGSKERFLEQKIPATYLALEDVVTYLSFERRLQGKDPVLRAEQYKSLVMQEMQQRFNITFRDTAELNQATTFLHENGVLLHYEDATLKDLYFLDPQWLCDMLAHVVTIREINPFTRNGIMKIEDLKHVFKSSQCAPADAQTYILNLLNKFEVALTWDNRTLLIPSLLPTEEQLRAGLPGCDVRIPVRSRSWALRKTFGSAKVTSLPANLPNLSLNIESKRLQQPPCPLSIDIISSPKTMAPFSSESSDGKTTLSPSYLISHETNQETCLRRLLLMSYFPSGFWSRLMTRILADDFIIEIIRSYFVVPKESQSDPVILSVLNCKAEWICWQTGMELRYIDTTLFRVKELLPYLDNSPCDYRTMRFLLQQEGMWTDVQINNSSILEIFLPNQKVIVQKLPNGYLHTVPSRDTSKRNANSIVLEPSKECTAKLLALTVDHIDTLLEDWYPTLGTRFVHTSEGKFLVTRLIPCNICLASHLKADCFNEESGTQLIDQYCDKNSWQIVDIASKNGLETCISKTVSLGGSSSTTSSSGRFSEQGGRISSLSPKFLQKSNGSHGSSMSHDSDSGVGPDSNSSSRKPSAEGRSDGENLEGHDDGGDASQGLGDGAPEYLVYAFMVEECILSAYEQKCVKCPLHNELPLSQIAPDTVFMDLGERFLIKPDTVRRGKMLGRGAFGFVFKATCKQRGSNSFIDVAMKMLQPVDPGFGARQSDAVAYKAAWSKWQRDPLQYACKAYCTARQELNILLSLRHQHIVPLVGVCTHPLSLVLHLAPQGALDCVLKNYRRSGAQLDLFVLQKIVIQIAKALEYLHQQHIIYRDLKSENVLVWELPPPFHPSQPHPNVEVKLADYGISRSTLPTGSKGFGGTEGFMAPEIMRYNGEEEYTEKVDCFSFGMFMYELITLHLPFEGQECVKDHILDGGRPSLTPREMLYPAYILDLMTLCWSQQPKDRPSASQIVSIATAPEFVHLVDVVSLHDHMAVLSAGVAEVAVKTEDESTFPLWEVWLGRLGKQIDILSCNQHGWQEYKTLTVENMTITSLCIVEDTIWLGDSRATVHVYSASQYTEMFRFRLDPDGGSPSAIRGLCYVPNLGCIAMATSSGRLWLCDSVHNMREKLEGEFSAELEEPCREYESLSDLEEVGIRELGSNGAPILSIAPLMTATNSCELWCGQTQGSISIFTLQDLVVTAQVVVNHYEPVMDNLDVFQLAAGSKDNPYVWSYLYPGCVVHQWDAANRTILNKLDCSKLAPCSESLMSISIEEHLSPGRCQVTAMAALGSELYIGTTWGCIVVAEGSTMRPVTVFRPFEEEVKAILPIRPTSGRKMSSSTKPTDGSESSSSSSRSPAEPMTPPTVITVGKGYRNLIARYVTVHGNESLAQRSMYLMVWRAENWSNS